MVRNGLVAIIILFSINVLVQALGVPVFEGSDEQRHYAYARYLVNNLSLPPRTVNAEPTIASYAVAQQSGQPPFYYICVALVTAAIPGADSTDPFTQSNPFVSSADDDGLRDYNHNMYLHGAEDRFPYQGVALAVRLGRMVSVIMGVATLLAVYAIAREIAPNQRAVALFAVGLVASVPQISFVFAMISNDSAVTLFSTLAVWMAVRLLRFGPSAALGLLGALFGGLAALSKINGLWAGPLVLVCFIIAAVMHRGAQPTRKTVTLVLLATMVLVVVCGWWFISSANGAGGALGLSTHARQGAGTARPILSSVLLAISRIPTTNLDLPGWERSLWYFSGWTMIKADDAYYWPYRLTWVIGLFAALLAGIKIIGVIVKQKLKAVHGIAVAQALTLVFAGLINIAGGYYFQLLGAWRLGRYLFPGFTSVAVIVAMGLVWMFRKLNTHVRLNPEYGKRLAGVICVAMIGWSGYATTKTITTLMPHSIVKSMPQDVKPTMLRYWDPADGTTPVADLIGYRLQPADLRQGSIMMADLCWHSTGFTRESFPYSVQLVGPDDIRPGTRNSFHGLGSYPMTAWSADEVFCDNTGVSINLSVDRPRAYQLVVKLFSLDPVKRIAANPLVSVDVEGRSVYPVIARVRVAPASMPIVTPTVVFGDFAGFTSGRAEIISSSTLSVSLRWVALRDAAPEAKIFIHLVDAVSGRILAQADHEPDQGWFPTSYWRKADVIDDSFTMPIPADIDVGNTVLQFGMYDAVSGERMPAFQVESRAQMPDNAFLLKISSKPE